MKIDNNTQKLFNQLILVLVIYVIFAKPILDKLGFTRSKGDKQFTDEVNDPDSAFGTNLWHRYFYMPGTSANTRTLISKEMGDRCLTAATTIHNAMGYFTDDEDKVKAAFNTLGSRCEVSLMSSFFTEAFKKDVLTYLRNGVDVMPQNGLGDQEISNIITYVNNLNLK